MYIDPNVGGVLFQAFAAVFAVVTGILFAFSRQKRARAARVRLFVRNRKNARIQNKETNK